MTIGAVYVRVSTGPQEAKGTSLQTQEQYCLAYAEKHGYKVTQEHIYREVHTGTELWERPQLTRLREAIRQKRIQAIVVISVIHGVGIVYAYSHSHFIAHTIEALGLAISGNSSRDGDTICIFLCLNRALVRCSALQASAEWPFKGGLETLCQESEERIGRCRVR